MTDAHDLFRGIGPADDDTTDDPTTSGERLLNRVVDGEATDAEWARFRALADAEFPGSERSAWRDLAEAQRQHAVLAAAVGRELAPADRHDLPRIRLGHGAPIIAGRIGALTGWAAAAAAIALVGANAWFGNVLRFGDPSPTPTTPVSTAGLFRIDSAEDAIEVYKDKGEATGRVIGEMPERVLVESRPLTDGSGFKVVYIRQFVECAEVTDLYRFGHSEGAGPVLIPVNAPPQVIESY
jgi:hypothetical protein